jgi:transcriptional regulator with XRE-family HTH domain
MNVIDCSVTGVEGDGGLRAPTPSPPLHRVGAVRRSQGISLRTVARHLGTDVGTIREEEQATVDMPLTRLYQWRAVLDVPVGELLTDIGDPLATPILRRAQLVRVMKTALSIMEEAEQESVRRMAQTMIDQLTQIMPELEGVGPWHTVGKRRRRDELGVAAQRRLSEDVFVDLFD